MKIITDILEIMIKIGGFQLIGIAIALYQIHRSQEQSKTQFEDSLNREYRDIMRKIPVEALLGKELDKEKYENSLSDFYSYIDLTNEQIFLWQKGRVRKKTWQEWCDGIRMNLDLPYFKTAWEDIKKSNVNLFQELRQLEINKFDSEVRR